MCSLPCMKITSVETHLLTIPYKTSGGLQFIAGQPAVGLKMVLVRVDTDQGVVGWGEAFGHAAANSTKTAIDTLLAPLLIGRDPVDIAGVMLDLQRKVHLLGRTGPVMYGLSGIDIALWDIAGKIANLPLYKLLGGADRTELGSYSSLLRCRDPGAVANACVDAVNRGFCHIKLHEITLASVASAREAVGAEIDLMLDTNCPWSVAEAVDMARKLTPYRLYWLEEPVWPPEDYEGLAQVRSAGALTSAGENATSLHDFRRMFELGSVAIAQPSVTKIGGISEMQKIIALGSAAGVDVVPHCGYLGSGFLATLHITAALSGDTLVERLNVDLEESPFEQWIDVANGKAQVPQLPGLGCDPDPHVLKRYRTHDLHPIR